MKHLKLFILTMLMIVSLTGCSGKAQEVAADPEQEAVQTDNSEILVRTCKLSACKLGYQSIEIIKLYETGEISLTAASKLLKMNYEDIKELHDMKIYSEDDDKYMLALYGNVMTAFNQLFEEGDGYIEMADYIAKCIEKLTES